MSKLRVWKDPADEKWSRMSLVARSRSSGACVSLENVNSERYNFESFTLNGTICIKNYRILLSTSICIKKYHILFSTYDSKILKVIFFSILPAFKVIQEAVM